MTLAFEQERLARVRNDLVDGSVLISGPNLLFRVIALKPGCTLVICKGGAKCPADTAAEEALFREFDRELACSATLTTFADVRETTQINSETRERTAAWARKHGSRIQTSHVLVRSKLIEMALSIVSMLVGGGSTTKFYSRPEAFLDVVRENAPHVVKLPTV